MKLLIELLPVKIAELLPQCDYRLGENNRGIHITTDEETAKNLVTLIEEFWPFDAGVHIWLTDKRLHFVLDEASKERDEADRAHALGTRPENIHATVKEHLPENVHYLLDGMDISIYGDLLQIRTNSREEAVDRFHILDWFEPVLTALQLENLVITDPWRYARTIPRDICRIWGAAIAREEQIRIRFNAFMDTLPPGVTAAIPSISFNTCRPDTISIHFCDGDVWPEHLKPVATVLEHLHWLGDADQFGFTQIRLIDVVARGVVKHYQTFSTTQLKEQRRANLARLLGEV